MQLLVGEPNPPPLVDGRASTRGTSCASHGSGRSTTRGISRRDATPWLTCHAKPPTKVWQVGSLRASVRHAEVNSRRSVSCSGPLDRRAQAEVLSAQRSQHRSTYLN